MILGCMAEWGGVDTIHGDGILGAVPGVTIGA